MREARHLRSAARPAMAALAAVWLALALAACGPGTGGTGLPPGDELSNASSAPAPTPITPTGSGLALPAPLPDRMPDLAGPIESVDADTLTIAGTRLPRAAVSLRDATGAPLAADAARTGRSARAWRAGEGWLVALGG